MQLGLEALFERAAAANGPQLLATVTATEGPTYRKAGAMALIGRDGDAAGLISGGCLEGDLALRAAAVFEDRVPRITVYDLRDDDPVWGIGLGCRGRIEILMEVADAGNAFAGLLAIEPHYRAGETCWLHKPLPDDGPPRAWQVTTEPLPDFDGLVIQVPPPRRLLVCGAGPDAVPLVRLASAIGWHVTVHDHREAFAQAAHFPDAKHIVCAPAPEAHQHAADAVVIMSHHVERDAEYLAAVSVGAPRYVGLLGPAERRREVQQAAGVTGRSAPFGPAGLDIGADLPETIALSILAEAQAVLSGHDAGHLSEPDRS